MRALSLGFVLILVACQGSVGSLTPEEASLCADHSEVGGQLLTEMWSDHLPELTSWLERERRSFEDGDAVIHGYYIGAANLPDAVSAELDARCREVAPVLRELESRAWRVKLDRRERAPATQA